MATVPFLSNREDDSSSSGKRKCNKIHTGDENKDRKLLGSTVKMCGFFSVTTDRKYDFSASALKYFKYPSTFPLDLNKGRDKFRPKPASYFNEKINNLLQYIVTDMAKLSSRGSSDNNGEALIPCAKFITYRGIIKTIFLTKYGNSSEWRLLACKYKGNIYISYTGNTDSFRDFCGPKLEQYCLIDDPNKSPDTTGIVDAAEQFFGVYKSNFVGKEFLYAGELDGLDSDRKLDLKSLQNFDNLKFIELKAFTEKYFERFKSLRTWIQCVLVGVNNVYIGFRDHQDKIHAIKYYTLEDLRSIWSKYQTNGAKRGFSFLRRVLENIEGELKSAKGPDDVLEIVCNRQNPDGNYTLHRGCKARSILPKWYLDATSGK